MKSVFIVLALLFAIEAQAVPPKKVCPKSCCAKLARENIRLRAQLRRYAPPPVRSAEIRFVDEPVEGLTVPTIRFVD